MTKVKRGHSSERSMSELTFDVNNFGPIAKGRVELRPLTVFAGSSNTGKSWLATLIYVMERHMKYNILDKTFFHYSEIIKRKSDNDISIFPEDPNRWLKDLKDHGQVRLIDTEIETVRKVLKSLGSELGDELLRCYGVGRLSDLIRQNHRGKAELLIRSGKIDHHLNLRSRHGKKLLDINITKPVFSYKDDILSHLDNFIAEFDVASKDTFQRDDRPFNRLDFWIIHMMSMVLQDLYSLPKGYSNAYCLPAGRGGVMNAHSVVVGALISNASRAGLRREAPLPMLPGVLADFLGQLIRIAESGSRKKNRHRSWDELIQNLESRILHGAVEIKQGETSYPHFVYRPKGWQRSLPLTNVSSMVSELTPVALYLRYLVDPGDLLIVEEPEAHLHPGMQRQFTENIARFVKAGVQILLTTHSEWVLEEIANIVARGENEREVENGEIGLKAKDVGVWLFDFKNKDKPELGSHIKEVRWEPDEGGYMTDYEEVAMALHNEWVNLMRQPA